MDYQAEMNVLGERARRAGGLVSKYRGRALLVTTGACAINWAPSTQISAP